MTFWNSTWRVPIALAALGTIPVTAGALRLVNLSGGTTAMVSDARYDATPLPVVLHIVCAAVFAIAGAFQFAPRLRRRRPGWHRRAGRVLIVAGLGVALSALWLNQYFPREGATRELLYPLRLVFGVALVATLVLGFLAARRRDFAHHRAWMIRSYAIGLVAGTQVFTLGIGEAVFGTGELTTALLLAAAWAINLAVAERAIRNRPHRRTSVTIGRMAPSDQPEPGSRTADGPRRPTDDLGVPAQRPGTGSTAARAAGRP
ncbi:Uncharacterized membrane protein [Geodermatophilus obscurus]|uniref:Uncharacterized membrane protein n=1 Tax=Geodermatophilus obscurus TaxID=1861 RepID=A0A1M7UZR3_9ACTN|nr:DUF2306 domain-containing protein [Geodermatophilus obscurus]SHN88416.1 Uncharacterized membrane protein [Geodermatophilus obscurus]